jgi:primosomal protein N''
VSILHFYFGWPEGAVWSNLLASAICSVLIWWRLRARMIAHHVEQLAQRDRHHEDMKAHVTAAVAAVRPAVRQAKTLVKQAKETGA